MTITTPELVLEFKEPVTFNIVRLREYLPLGQRIDDWALDAWQDAEWHEFAKLARPSAPAGSCAPNTPRTPPPKCRLRITKAAACPALIGVRGALIR
jgi:alpha-L-fucosidase